MIQHSISVVIPSYNRSNWIFRAIDSVIAQTYPPNEIIIVDDGSSDQTFQKIIGAYFSEDNGIDFNNKFKSLIEITSKFDLDKQVEFEQTFIDFINKINETPQSTELATWLDEPVFTISIKSPLKDPILLKYYYQFNAGGNVARNNGIRFSQSDFIAFLDSDDRWHPQKLEKQISVFNSNYKASAVYCGLVHENLNTGEIIQASRKFLFPKGNILPQLLVEDVTAPTSCYLIKGSVFNSIGMFDENLKARQDWEMWLRISTRFEFDCVAENLVFYGEHQNDRTSTNPDNEIIAYKYIRNKYRTQISNLPRLQQVKALAFYLKRRSTVELHYKKNRIHAFRFALLSVMIFPFSISVVKQFLRVFIPK